MADSDSLRIKRRRVGGPGTQPTHKERPRQSEQEEESSTSESKTDIDSRWKEILEEPEKIHLKFGIAVCTTKRCFIVYYAPEKPTDDCLVPWKRGTDVKLEVPCEAAIVTWGSREMFGSLSFGEDADKVMMYVGGLKMTESECLDTSLAAWWADVVKTAGHSGELFVPERPTQARPTQLIQEHDDVNAERIRFLVQRLKKDFAKRSGLSLEVVADIFKRRTTIAVSCSPNSTVFNLCDDNKAHVALLDTAQCLNDSIIAWLPSRCCAWLHGAEKIRKQFEACPPDTTPGIFCSQNHDGATLLVVDIGEESRSVSLIATRSTETQVKLESMWPARGEPQSFSQLTKLVKEYLETKHPYAELIRTAAQRSHVSLAKVVAGIVDGFERVKREYSTGNMYLPFPESVKIELHCGHRSSILTGLTLSEVEAKYLFDEWLRGIAKQASDQVSEFEIEVEIFDYRRLKLPYVVLTGCGSQPPYVREAFKALMLEEEVDVEIVVDDSADSSDNAAKGAFWSLTVDKDGWWKIEP